MSNQIITLSDVNAKLDILTNAVLSNKQTLNIDEAAMYSCLSVSYLYKLTSTQQIPHFKPRGKIIYFDRSELDEWLRDGVFHVVDAIDGKKSNGADRIKFFADGQGGIVSNWKSGQTPSFFLNGAGEPTPPAELERIKREQQRRAAE